MKKLDRNSAIQLLPAVIDNEASYEERIAFFDYIEKDEAVRIEYENALFIKKILNEKLTKARAPESLKQRVNKNIQDIALESKAESNTDNSSVAQKSDGEIDEVLNKRYNPFRNIHKPFRYIAAAAVILILSLVTIELLDRSSQVTFETQSVELAAFTHFMDETFDDVSLSGIIPDSVEDASDYLHKELSHPLRLPLIDGAEINRVIYADFIADFKTPVIDFYQSDIDEHVIVFAFDIDQLKSNKKIVRDPEAVDKCKTYDDYHIREIEDKHVVSWKWGDYWYTAISNHNGEDLIALVEPLWDDTEIESDRW